MDAHRTTAKRFERPRRLRTILLTGLLLLVAVGCGGSKDDRDEIRAQYGEPDDILMNEGPVADSEVWYYADFAGSGTPYCYEFRRNRNSCGSSKGYFLVADGAGLCSFYFIP